MTRRSVVLYNPRAVFWTMPLALVAIGSALDRERCDVRIVDGRLVADPSAAVLAAIDSSTVAVGMTVLTGAPIRDALAVTRAVQRAHPSLPIIWGGWHPSLFPEQCVRDARIQAAVVGQGERTFAELVERCAAGASPAGVMGGAWPDGDRVVIEPPRPTEDVNRFPAHDYSLIDVPAYFARKGRRQFDYISSQGCRFRCEFCADPFVYGRSWFGLAPARMAEELAAVHARHPFDDVNFQDETFFTSGARAAAVAEALLARDLRVTWAATMRADQGARMDDAVLALCKPHAHVAAAHGLSSVGARPRHGRDLPGGG